MDLEATQRELERFWPPALTPSAVDRMAGELTDDFVQLDHRALHTPRGDRDDWRHAMRAWATLVERTHRAVEAVAAAPGLRAYRLVFGGEDRITGGALEVEIFIVERLRDGRPCVANVFDDRDAALAFFERERDGR